VAHVKLEDPFIEKYILASCLKGPEFWKNIPENWLSDPIAVRTYRELKKYLDPPYMTYPTSQVVVEKTEDADVKLFIKEIESIEVNKNELNVRVSDLFDMYAARKALEVADSIRNDIDKVKINDIVRSKITEFMGLVNPFEAGVVERRLIYDSTRERWKRYREVEKDKSKLLGIPYHIKDLDKLTNGGIRKGHIVLLYGISGGYKTRTKANLAYNFAFLEKKDTQILTLEVNLDDYERIIDSRHSFLSYGNIETGELKDQRQRYRDSLIDIEKSKYPLQIVDIPDKATSADVIKELELHRAMVGQYPDIVVIDYIGEMEPLEPWTNTGEKFKNLGKELRRIARSYDVGIVTSMQINKKGKELVNKDNVGTEHIGESFSIQNVCHLIIHLWQDQIEEVENILHWSIKKNRYGKKHETFDTFCNAEYNFVGDRKIE